MRHRSLFEQTDRSIEVAMTPMIDVVFMLLIFFVWTASFQIAELVLPSSLVTEHEGSAQLVDPELEDLERIVVRIVSDSGQTSWTVNDVPVTSFDQVRDRLQAIAAISVSLPVLVDPDAAVPLGTVIDVYDAAKLAGFQKVQFAASSG